MVKNLPTMQETRVWSLGQQDPLEKGMATHSSILAWRIWWTEEPGRLQSIGLQRAGHDWETNTFTFQIKFLKSITFLMAQTVKNLPAMHEIWVWFLGQEDPLEKQIATQSSILAWRISWTQEPCRPRSMGSQRVGHDWVNNTFTFHQIYFEFIEITMSFFLKSLNIVIQWITLNKTPILGKIQHYHEIYLLGFLISLFKFWHLWSLVSLVCKFLLYLIKNLYECYATLIKWVAMSFFSSSLRKY